MGWTTSSSALSTTPTATESMSSNFCHILSGYYQNTLNDKSVQEKREWAEIVLEQMKQEGLDLQNDEFIVLAGDYYCKYLQDSLSVFSRPLKGLKQGEQMQKLNQLLGICKK